MAPPVSRIFPYLSAGIRISTLGTYWVCWVVESPKAGGGEEGGREEEEEEEEEEEDIIVQEEQQKQQQNNALSTSISRHDPSLPPSLPLSLPPFLFPSLPSSLIADSHQTVIRGV